MKKIILFLAAALMASLLIGAFPASANDVLSEALLEKVNNGSDIDLNVLISTSNKNYNKIIAKINAVGGSVTNTYKYANGLSATISVSGLAELSGMKGIEQISLDTLRYPGPAGGYNVQAAGGASIESKQNLDSFGSPTAAFTMAGDFETITLSGDELDTYYNNNANSMNTAPVHASGNMGEDSLVVVIDTGTYSGHFMLSGTVVGGLDLSTDVGTGFEGYDLITNHFHGTHVGGIIAGHGAIIIPNDSLLALSYEYNSGEALPVFDASNKIMPLMGTAPAASIYAIKVFPHTGAGAPESTIIAAIEHAIDLQVSGAEDVDVINMSLGGGTGFEGYNLEDQAVDYATSVGITVVDSAGNDGPASETIGSPAAANTSITTGAVSHPVNTRVFWDNNYGFVGAGDLLTVDDNPQMVYFSSRGPTSDGRDKPTASAVGAFVLSAFTGSPGALGWASGTSMSSPAMAGIVALLNSHSESNSLGGSPYDYKQAVIAGSHPLAGFEAYEQGAGFINAEDALNAFIADGEYGSEHPAIRRGHTGQSVTPEGKNLQGVNGGSVTFEIKDLAPGYVEDFYFRLHPNAEKITVEFSNVDLGVDPIAFNAFEVHLMSAMRTTDTGYYLYSVNVWGDAVLTVESMNSSASGFVYGVNTSNLPLMDGFVRLSIENDWTSYDSLSGTVTVSVVKGDNSDQPDETYSGKLGNHESYGFFPVGFGSNGVELELNWMHDWSAFPTADMDMIVAWFDTDGNLHFEFGGATFNSPEIVSINASNIAEVLVLIDGFETYDLDEPWTLEVRHK